LTRDLDRDEAMAPLTLETSGGSRGQSRGLGRSDGRRTKE